MPHAEAPGGEGRGVLCLHGLTGSPFELQPLADACTGRGWNVELPLLPGHGGDVRALSDSSWRSWLAAANDGLDRLRTISRHPVAVVGSSMGGLLALRLAVARPADVGSLVVMGVPLRLPWFQRAGLRAFSLLPRIVRTHSALALPKLRGVDVSDPEIRRRCPSSTHYSLPALVSMLELMELTVRELHRVSVPTLIVHARADRTVPFSQSTALARSLGSAVVERLTLTRSGHLVAVDVEAPLVIGDAVRFIRRHAG